MAKSLAGQGDRWAGHGDAEGRPPTATQAHSPVVTVSCNGAVRAVIVTLQYRNIAITAHLLRECSQVQAGV